MYVYTYTYMYIHTYMTQAMLLHLAVDSVPPNEAWPEWMAFLAVTLCCSRAAPCCSRAALCCSRLMCVLHRMRHDPIGWP